MDAVLRAAAIYVFLLIIFRIAGRRTLAEINTFDFVLLLILGEATQQGLIGDDFSVTRALLLITSLIGLDIGMSFLQRRFRTLDKIIDGVPLIIVEDGEPVKDRMDRARIDEADVLEAGRLHHGLERMDQIKYAVLERDGGISIIPKAEASWRNQAA
jgi:uncharacterized membrane protein YcaP (DUF421 family)